MTKRFINGKKVIRTKKKEGKFFVKFVHATDKKRTWWVEMDFNEYIKRVRYEK